MVYTMDVCGAALVAFRDITAANRYTKDACVWLDDMINTKQDK